MNLREYQAKRIFANYGISIPQGEVITKAESVLDVGNKIGYPLVLKPQLGVKGRAKVGGIRFVECSEMAIEEAQELFAMSIKGETVQSILVEKKIPAKDELYLAVAVDYATRQPVVMISSAGGVEIEETAKTEPDRILKIPVNILTSLTDNDLAIIRQQFGNDLAECTRLLYRIFRDYDAELVEINPLIRTEKNELWAVDGVLNVDDDSLFRHEDLLIYREEIPIDDPIVEEARRTNWTYIDLPGDIAILSSGAGLTMAILDLIHKAGGQAANFLDTAQIDDDGIYHAFSLLSRAKTSRVILVNIFAGLNRCDTLAWGIIRYLNDFSVDVPIVVRMIGNMEEEGHEILKQAGLLPFIRIEDAIELAVRLAKKI